MTIATAFAVTACGGDPSSAEPSGPTVSPTEITGTAAVGLPLVGTVTVKDALGATLQAQIRNGSYTIDVAGLTAPFLFRAEGYAGGHKYVVHSAATQADVGNTINITPLTDLVLSNIAGQVAATYFDNPSNNAGLTAAALDAEAEKLRERLLPLLQAMGVDASIDLLRTPFTPLSSALDKAIDVLRVDYAAGVATITNVVTQQQIQDNLATQAAQEAAPPTLNNTTGVADSATDIDQIRARLLAFSSHFASGSPALGVLEPYLSPDFLHDDADGEDTLVNYTSFAPLVGSQFTDVTIHRIDYSDPQRPVADVSFLMKGSAGTLISFEKHWQMAKENGQWLLRGDQRTLDIEVVAFMNNSTYLSKSPGAQPTECRESGFSLIVDDYTGANSANVAYAVVRGPGLPGGGVRLDKPQQGGAFQQPARPNSGNFYALTSSCDPGISISESAISAIPDNAEYTVTAYDAQNAQVGAVFTETVTARPLTLAELNAATFPNFGGLSLNDWASFNGGTLNLQIGGLNPTGLGLAEGYVGYSNGGSADAEDEKAASSQGTMSATLALSAAPGGAFIQHRTLELYRWDNDWREFSTRWVVSGQ